MMDRVMAIFALLMLGAFLWILVSEVPRLDLGAVTVATFLLVAYDFLFSDARAGKR